MMTTTTTGVTRQLAPSLAYLRFEDLQAVLGDDKAEAHEAVAAWLSSRLRTQT